MITRAEVTEVLEHKVRVRIPILDNVPGAQQYVHDEDLSIASIIVTPGIAVQYKVGDIVVVGFENNNVGYPIVLGHLKSALKDSDERNININTTTMHVKETLTAPIATEIGRISYNQLQQAVDYTGEE